MLNTNMDTTRISKKKHRSCLLFGKRQIAKGLNKRSVCRGDSVITVISIEVILVCLTVEVRIRINKFKSEIIEIQLFLNINKLMQNKIQFLSLSSV